METVGLRERKKAATRQAVHEAALRLTVEHGIEHATVEAIADAAGISRRTFSNYFAGKEAALLYGEEQHMREFVQRVRDRPAAEAPWAALCGAFRDLAFRSDRSEREWAVRTRLAMRHPSLLARQLANHSELEAELARTVTERGVRTATGVSPRVLTAAFLSSLRIAMRSWMAQPSGPDGVPEGGPDLVDVIEEVLDEMARSFD